MLDAAVAPADSGDVYLWPCNVTAWHCWCAVQTQWRAGFNGATGLDYAAVLGYLQTVARQRGRRLRDVFQAIQAAERAVLDVWADRRGN